MFNIIISSIPRRKANETDTGMRACYQASCMSQAPTATVEPPRDSKPPSSKRNSIPHSREEVMSMIFRATVKNMLGRVVRVDGGTEKLPEMPQHAAQKKAAIWAQSRVVSWKLPKDEEQELLALAREIERMADNHLPFVRMFRGAVSKNRAKGMDDLQATSRAASWAFRVITEDEHAKNDVKRRSLAAIDQISPIVTPVFAERKLKEAGTHFEAAAKSLIHVIKDDQRMSEHERSAVRDIIVTAMVDHKKTALVESGSLTMSALNDIMRDAADLVDRMLAPPQEKKISSNRPQRPQHQQFQQGLQHALDRVKSRESNQLARLEAQVQANPSNKDLKRKLEILKAQERISELRSLIATREVALRTTSDSAESPFRDKAREELPVLKAELEMLQAKVGAEHDARAKAKKAERQRRAEASAKKSAELDKSMVETSNAAKRRAKAEAASKKKGDGKKKGKKGGKNKAA